MWEYVHQCVSVCLSAWERKIGRARSRSLLTSQFSLSLSLSFSLSCALSCSLSLSLLSLSLYFVPLVAWTEFARTPGFHCSVALCCSVLQCVKMCCSVLKCLTVCCSVLQCVTCKIFISAQTCFPLQCCSVLQCVAVWCSCYSVL